MKTIKLIQSIPLGVILCGAFSVAVAAESVKSESKTPWKIAGSLEEACSCRAACPCWFKSLPTRMTCDGVQVVFISKGRYGKTSLEGLAVGEFVQSPEHKSMFESFGNWNFEYIYIDEKANAEQRQALKEIAAHLFPAAAKQREFRYVPVSRTIAGDEHTMTIGSYGSFSGHLVEGGYGASPKVVNPPLADPTHKEYLQGEATRLNYKDAGQDWKYENSNYMRNKFEVTSKEYEKHEAMMAKKMAQTKSKT